MPLVQNRCCVTAPQAKQRICGSQHKIIFTWTRRLGKSIAGKWTGVRLRHLLQKCYAHRYQEGARHVHVNGVEREVPLGKMGCYGTSIPLCSANNAANDIIIAYKHNGKASSAESYHFVKGQHHHLQNSLADQDQASFALC